MLVRSLEVKEEKGVREQKIANDERRK